MVTDFVERLTTAGFKVDGKNSKNDLGTNILPFSYGKTRFTVYFNSSGEVWQLDSKKGKVETDILTEKYKKVKPLFLKDIEIKVLRKYT